ncbi:MAG: Crp/Fnr family transcriptional regulator [Bacteroidetes bacterium]|nr:Crp/Fnr family transcriptional regulator [Bacteroidota bacterium]MBS1931583.1 Crp/Fnr family transcriptional regulator [Bacteroidota bacterium]
MERPSTFKNVFAHKFEPALLAELESRSILMNVSSGETLLKIGKPVTGVPLMLNGTIKVSRENDEGQELLLYYITSGETCPMTLTCFMTSQLSSVTASTEEDSSFWVVPGNVVEELFVSHPAWKKFVMNTILDGLTQIIKSVDDVAFKKMDDRLIAYMKQRSNITGSSLINVSHQQIADDLGTNRVVISRLLKKLETDKKLLLYRNQIKLLKDL